MNSVQYTVVEYSIFSKYNIAYIKNRFDNSFFELATDFDWSR